MILFLILFSLLHSQQLASGKNVILLNTTAKHQNHPTGSVIQSVNTSDSVNDDNIRVSEVIITTCSASSSSSPPREAGKKLERKRESVSNNYPCACA